MAGLVLLRSSLAFESRLGESCQKIASISSVVGFEHFVQATWEEQARPPWWEADYWVGSEEDCNK
jgi:hypothetical protein